MSDLFFLTSLCFLQGVADIDNIVGLKYTAPDYFPMQNILDLSAGKLRVWSG